MKILITGASRGIGFETVKQLAKDPSNQILALSRNFEKLVQLQEFCLENHQNNIQIHSFDLSQIDKPSLDKHIDQMGGLDVLIHNAGLLISKKFEELTLEDWHSMYEVNVFGVVQLTQIALPYLKKSQFPHIVTIGSMGGFQGSSKFPTLSAYSSSKAAVAGLMECLAEEFKPYGIAANCLAIGAVQTEMLETAFPGVIAPLNPSEMGAYVANFALEGHRYFNGKVLPVSSSTP